MRPADSQDAPSLGEVVQKHHAAGHHVGVVVGETDDPGAQPDVPGVPGGGDEYLRR